MIYRHVAWTCWALLPIFGLAYHFGPGQRLYHRDSAARALSQANAAQLQASDAQGAAYAQHLKAIDARRAAFLSQDPTDAAKAKTAGAQEEAAYEIAATAWKAAADSYQRVQDTLADGASEIADRVRWSHARALIHAGQIATGVDELEDLLDKLTDQGKGDSELARKCREEAATGYYYGARLMRLSGRPASEWKEISGRARQNFRYLAETSGADPELAKNHQNNLELVLNLEQSSLEDIQAKPLPKDSPRGNRDGLGQGQRKGKSKRPPRRGPPNNGAGGAGEVEGGW
jgi:hypothetical protein